VEAQKYFFPGRRVPLLRYWSRYAIITSYWLCSGTGRLNLSGGGKNRWNMGQTSLKLFWQRRDSILFSMLMFMPVVPAILTRNERLSVSLSSRVALSFQWVPGHAGLTGNELADSLAKTGQHSPLPMFFAHWPWTLQRLDTLATLSGDEIFLSFLSCQIPSVSLEELALPRLIHCKLSRLRCHGHNLLLSSYLCRIKCKENSFSSACGHPLQDLTHLLLMYCSASEPLRRAIFGTTSYIFDLWSIPWGVARLLGLPIPRKRSGSTTTTRNESHIGITIGDRIFGGRCKIFILPKSNQILLKFAQMSPKFNQICPNLLNFATKVVARRCDGSV